MKYYDLENRLYKYISIYKVSSFSIKLLTAVASNLGKADPTMTTFKLTLVSLLLSSTGAISTLDDDMYCSEKLVIGETVLGMPITAPDDSEDWDLWVNTSDDPPYGGFDVALHSSGGDEKLKNYQLIFDTNGTFAEGGCPNADGWATRSLSNGANLVTPGAYVSVTFANCTNSPPCQLYQIYHSFR